MTNLNHTRRFWWTWGVTLLGLLGLVGIISLPPFVSPEVRSALMGGFHFVCHQMPERSPHIDGIQLTVCHRCYGIYWGLVLAAILWLGVYTWSAALNRRARVIVALSLLPLGVDWGGQFLDVWTNTPVSRLVTGGIFGIVAGLYLVRALVETTKSREAERVS